MKALGLLIVGGLLATGSLMAADEVDGKWECGVTAADGVTRPMIATLKSDGMALTGTVNGMNGQPDIPISEAMNHGKEVMWSAKRPVQNEVVQFNYRGAITGAEMKIDIVRADGKGAPMTCVAKKAK